MLKKIAAGELIQRLKADTPDWWKKIRKYALYASGAAGALLAANGNAGYTLPEILHGLCDWIMTTGIVLAFVASTAKKDSQPDQ